MAIVIDVEKFASPAADTGRRRLMHGKKGQNRLDLALDREEGTKCPPISFCGD